MNLYWYWTLCLQCVCVYVGDRARGFKKENKMLVTVHLSPRKLLLTID